MEQAKDNLEGGLDIPSLSAVPSIRTASMLARVVHGAQPAVLFVYSPQCYWSKVRAPEYAAAVKGVRGFWRYNAVPSAASTDRRHREFQTIVGHAIRYYPMIVGISRAGRLVEYNGELDRAALSTFLKALSKT